MISDQLIRFFLPAYLKDAPLHEEYKKVVTIISCFITGCALLFVLALVLIPYEVPVTDYLINAVMCIVTLVLLKYFGIYRIPIFLTAATSYFCMSHYILSTGGIYSPNVSLLAVILIAGFWANGRIGLSFIPLNIIFLVLIYSQTPQLNHPFQQPYAILANKTHALIVHGSVTLFLAIFFWFVQLKNDQASEKITQFQQNIISYLNREVQLQTEQISTMRQNLAADFHDETGNMLSAITRQASLLKLKLNPDQETAIIVDHIISNSNQLYASTKQFLWILNNDSDDPQILFEYLTSFGQTFYNQFDMSFSAENHLALTPSGMRLEPLAAINLFFIFKEAMTNVVKHSGATEVLLSMSINTSRLLIMLSDNGQWKESAHQDKYHGLYNIEKRSEEHSFRFMLDRSQGTSIRVEVPVLSKK